MDIPKKRIDVKFYELSSGQQPVRMWLLALSAEDRRIVGKDFQYLEFRWPVGMPRCRPLSHGLWELRSHISQNRITRVLFGIVKGELVLLHAFIKKTEQTPAHDLALGIERLKHLQR